MSETPRVKYDRAPSKELQGLLKGPLSWLVEFNHRPVGRQFS